MYTQNQYSKFLLWEVTIFHTLLYSESVKSQHDFAIVKE